MLALIKSQLVKLLIIWKSLHNAAFHKCQQMEFASGISFKHSFYNFLNSAVIRLSPEYVNIKANSFKISAWCKILTII